jgi:WD40 repeat protein
MQLCSGTACLLLLAPSLLPAQQPKLSRTLEAGSVPAHLAFSPDGRTLASAGAASDPEGRGEVKLWAEGPGEVKLWDVATGKNTATLKGHAGKVWGVAFSPDGKTLASGGGRSGNAWPGTGELKLWDVATGKNIATLKSYPGVVCCVAFSPDGKALASSIRDGTVRLWEVATGKNSATFEAPEYGGLSLCVAFSPDGKTVAVGGGPVKQRDGPGATGEIQLWDLAAGKKTATLQGHPGDGCFSNMFARAFSVAFSPDGKVLVSGGARTIELWEVATGKNLATFQYATGAVVWRAELSPDGKTVAWVGGPQDDWRAELSPDGKAVVWVGGPQDDPAACPPPKCPIRLLDVTTGKTTAILKAHAGGVLSVVYSPDGRTLASGGADSMIRLWDIAAARQAGRPR